jgi:hypothetical protein
MTPEEFRYIKRAVETLETTELSLKDQRKIFKTISEITAAAAVRVQDKLVDSLAD